MPDETSTRCRACGSKIVRGDSFCRNCGASLRDANSDPEEETSGPDADTSEETRRPRLADEMYCPHCGEIISKEAAACPHCGQVIQHGASGYVIVGFILAILAMFPGCAFVAGPISIILGVVAHNKGDPLGKWVAGAGLIGTIVGVISLILI